jgi:predicted secreted protein
VPEKIQTNVGKQFEISLKGNPSTGYRWEPLYDATIIDFFDQGYQSETGKPGSSGVETFHFRALKVGHTEVVMTLKRRWEREALQKEIFEISIT